jgi:hypothetical protein
MTYKLPAPFMELHKEVVPAVYGAWAAQMQQAYQAGRDAMREEAMTVAAMFSINKHAIHPDIAFDQMHPDVQANVHATCQYITDEIGTLK